MPRQAFFLPAASGQRFCLLHLPDPPRPAHGAIVYLHPFAEELNRSRRMAAAQASAFARAGFAVLQIDLHGCGDSSGDFADATWSSWLDDGRLAAQELLKRCPAPLWWWGLRSGGLLASVLAQSCAEPAGLLLWQPWSNGKQGLQQFLRIGMAAELASGSGKEAAQGLRSRLAAGDPVEVAGYTLSPTLADQLESATLLPPPAGSRFAWMEFSARPEPTLSPAAEAMSRQWQLAGATGQAIVLPAQAFWLNADTPVDNALLEATVSALAESARR
jgi:uncharacterized protein